MLEQLGCVVGDRQLEQLGGEEVVHGILGYGKMMRDWLVEGRGTGSQLILSSSYSIAELAGGQQLWLDLLPFLLESSGEEDSEKDEVGEKYGDLLESLIGS